MKGFIVRLFGLIIVSLAFVFLAACRGDYNYPTVADDGYQYTSWVEIPMTQVASGRIRYYGFIDTKVEITQEADGTWVALVNNAPACRIETVTPVEAVEFHSSKLQGVDCRYDYDHGVLAVYSPQNYDIETVIGFDEHEVFTGVVLPINAEQEFDLIEQETGAKTHVSVTKTFYKGFEFSRDINSYQVMIEETPVCVFDYYGDKAMEGLSVESREPEMCRALLYTEVDGIQGMGNSGAAIFIGSWDEVVFTTQS